MNKLKRIWATTSAPFKVMYIDLRNDKLGIFIKRKVKESKEDNNFQELINLIINL